ncbi:MAG: iron ABC transporter permease [Butyrivibrio sp.]|nr:iron ABC transporter permease [Muribaculum sp.]MCM1553391.1 iron ABC transporter permease [Butyrivibrio sp.]
MSPSSIYPKSNKRNAPLLFAILLAAVLAFFVLNLMIGSVEIPFRETLVCLLGNSLNPTFYSIIWKIRFPRAIAAVLLGGALALSGYLLQTFFHNPIAGPFVLGISSGAKLVVALAMVFFLGRGLEMGAFSLVAAAFIGAMLSMGFVLLIARKLRQSAMLIVSGIMVGYICSAVTDLVVTFADDSDIVNLHNWSMGSFSGISWADVGVMAIVVLLTGMVVFAHSKQLGAYQMGDAYAENMGLNIRRFRVMLVLLSGILSACVTAFAGPVSFVGIAVPQLAKRLFHTSKPLLMIPACFLGGAFWCLLCDLLARTVFAPTELSISTVTAIFGVPVVIWVLIDKRKGNPD